MKEKVRLNVQTCKHKQNAVISTAASCLTGVLKFARLVKMYETQDPEIAAMSVKLKSLLLPPLSTPPIGSGIPTS